MLCSLRRSNSVNLRETFQCFFWKFELKEGTPNPPTLLPRGAKPQNFPGSNFLCAKTFRMKCAEPLLTTSLNSSLFPLTTCPCPPPISDICSRSIFFLLQYYKILTKPCAQSLNKNLQGVSKKLSFATLSIWRSCGQLGRNTFDIRSKSANAKISTWLNTQ